MFKEYNRRRYDVLDVQSKYLTKMNIEVGEGVGDQTQDGQLTIRAANTIQMEDGINYICSCYWKSESRSSL